MLVAALNLGSHFAFRPHRRDVAPGRRDWADPAGDRPPTSAFVGHPPELANARDPVDRLTPARLELSQMAVLAVAAQPCGLLPILGLVLEF